ncbi:hypothetical protein FisN_1Lh021 [Fistulifera solaris]|uniref:Uncharacterized protein n=1 Tax=Fistulifera solaris TaxID=1519565 RepID=A0A1Z5JC73_FISSO|nr:hypothetical protein FisN_1Lh021 [Fistulifera solaris]|eukprot:GAX11614.1 hypothetical protein FisN_1Lh021 [Fistulifera solaris]
MVYVTVLLLRCGETQVDAFGDYEPPPDTTDDDNVLLSPSGNNPSYSPSSSTGIPKVVESPSLLHNQQQQHEEDEEVINVSDEDDDDGEEEGEIRRTDDRNSQAIHDKCDKKEEKDTLDTQKRGKDVSDQIEQHPSSPASLPVDEAASQPVTKPSDDYDERPRRLRLSEYIDPFMTQKGYHTAQEAFTSLMAAISQSTTEERRMACFSAPTKACTGTAYMVGCSNLNQYNNLRWQLSTKKCLQAPCAIPIVVHNSLCTKDPKIDRCGGYQPVIDAGLLHCSASPWNDARQKCPFSLIVKKFKYKIKAWVREWKDEEQVPVKEISKIPVEKETMIEVSKEDDSEKVDDDDDDDDDDEQQHEEMENSVNEKHLEEEDIKGKEEEDGTKLVNEEGDSEKVSDAGQQGEDIEKTLNEDLSKKEDNWEEEEEEEEEGQMRPRRVLDIQYFRLDDSLNPWSLKPMVLKNNALIDLIDPFRYMTPPRKGNLGLKRSDTTKRPGPAEAVQQAVWWARQVGCDVVIMVVGETAMQELAKAGGLLGDDDQLEVPPCSLATLIADVPDLELSDDDDQDDNDDADDQEAGNEDIGVISDDGEVQENGEDVAIDGSVVNVGIQTSDVIERGTDTSSDRKNDNDGEQGDDGEANEKPFADYDFTRIRLGFHGFFTVEDLIKDPSQVIPTYTGPVDVLVPPPPDNNPMDIPVNQWSVFSPPKAENITSDYPDLPPFSQALQLPLPKRFHYKPPKIQYEKQISPLVPPNMPNPYMSPQRHGVPFTSTHGTPAPPRDREDGNDLDRSGYEVRVPYGQRQSYIGQPFSPVQSQQSYRGASYAPPQHDFGQPYVSPPQPYRGPFYPPDSQHFERPPFSPARHEQPYRGPYSSQQQPIPQYFQGQDYPPQRQFAPNSRGQHHSPVYQPYGTQSQSPLPHYNQVQGHSYPPQHRYDGQSYPRQQNNHHGQHDGPPSHNYFNTNTDRYMPSNHPHGATSPGAAPSDWDDA